MLRKDEYLATIKSDNSRKVVESVLKNIPNNIDFENISVIELDNLILSLKPNSPKAIITILYVLNLYAKWCGYKDTEQKILSVNKKVLWIKAKPNAPKKYISHESYVQVLHDIGVYEEMNGFFYQTLLKAIYEGIYNDDMSVLDNLRANDINGSIITLHDADRNEYELKVSENLANELKELSETNTWQRKNRYGYFDMKVDGKYSDSVFKFENRNREFDKSFRFSYYAKLRKISNDYLEYNLLPLQIYISGIMYRIRLELEKHNITLEDAFADENRNRTVNSVIESELKRCHYDIGVKNFREIVKGFIDVFEN